MKRLALVVLPLIASLTVGCNAPEAFNRKSAKISCAKSQECNKAAFESLYSSMSDCVDTVSEDLNNQVSTCEYDGDEGNECLRLLRSQKNDCNLSPAQFEEFVRECLGESVFYSC